jgi:hypothetical protein
MSSGAAPEDDGMMARYYRAPLATRAILSMNAFFYVLGALVLPVDPKFLVQTVIEGFAFQPCRVLVLGLRRGRIGVCRFSGR